MFVDHLIQYRISSWSKTIEERGFGTCVTDEHTDGPTDKPSYRDAFLTHASKKLFIYIFKLGSQREIDFLNCENILNIHRMKRNYGRKTNIASLIHDWE